MGSRARTPLLHRRQARPRDRWRRLGLQKLASLRQALVARAAGEEAVVADTVEALGQDVDEKRRMNSCVPSVIVV
jgi:hypothetical protein